MSIVPVRGKRTRIASRPLLLALCCAAAFPATAEQVMTVTAPDRDPGRLITSTQTPRQPVPASDGADLLKTIPGFSVVRSGGSNGDPVLRGMFGSRLNILTDGASVQGGCGSRMDTPTAYITPKSYDTLTVIKGPQTVTHGPMAPAGTLLFERQPELFSEPGIKGSVDLLQGANGRSDQNVNAAFGNASGYVRLDGNRSVSDDYRDGNGQVVPSLWRKWNGGVTVGMTPDDDTLVEVSASAGDGKARYAGRMMDGSRFARRSATVKLEKYNLSDTLSKISLESYYNDTDHIMDNYSLREPVGPKRSTEVGGVTWGSRLSGVWEDETTQLTAGTDVMRKSHRKKSGGEWRDDAVFTQFGAFGELRQAVSDDSTAIVGARLDSIKADDKRAQSQGSRSSVLPGAFARYEFLLPDAPVMIYSGIGYTERFPDYWELFSGKAGKESFSTLKSEKTLQWDSGLQFKGDEVNAWASVYVGRIADYILFDYSRVPSQASNINATVMGGETGASWQFAPHWTLESTLNYAWGENRSDGTPLPQMPPLEGRLGINYEQDSWSTGLMWRGVAPQHRVAKQQGNVVGQDFGPSAGFGVLAWNADYAVTNNLMLSAGIDNLLNKAYSEHLNLAGASEFGYASRQQIAEPGRTWWLEMNYHF
ncbi:TonB-dependent copper receptor [Enterobacter sp. CC120223-11]|uniref:TonB-dependent copper receptor n=1 Tax=Enterobacter sp. CC120223-11 TaxID=1378073 RepID=UPI000BCD6707|nr:TonB-dependent copper receptor [Enterobacter sp. CC120223-11]SNY65796.1 iron complex outermembrane recepter protein [Enterobacter sp. CC120223-11]